MRKNLFSIILILISTSCFCQKNNWLSGYIIKIQGDTVYGFIDNNDSRINAKQCSFRTDMEGKTQKFIPDELLGYRFIDGKYYVSKSIDKTGSGNLIFLEFLIQGKLNIYHLKEENISRFFAEKDGKLVELKNTKAIQSVGNTDYQNEKREYIGTLNYMLMDANMLQDIQQTELNSKSLINTAKNYHEKVCTDEKCIIYERSSKPIHVIFSLHTGISLNKFNWGGCTTTDYRPSSLFGCRFEFENAFEWVEKLTFKIDISYQRYTNYTLEETEKSDDSDITYNQQDYILSHWNYVGIQNLDVNLKTNALKIPISLNYNFSKNTVKPYVGAGVSTMYILSQNNDFIYHRFYNEFNKSIPTFHIGVIGYVGSSFRFKNNQGIYVELSYDNTKSINENELVFKLSSSNFTLNCGYFF